MPVCLAQVGKVAWGQTGVRQGNLGVQRGQNNCRYWGPTCPTRMGTNYLSAHCLRFLGRVGGSQVGAGRQAGMAGQGKVPVSHTQEQGMGEEGRESTVFVKHCLGMCGNKVSHLSQPKLSVSSKLSHAQRLSINACPSLNGRNAIYLEGCLFLHLRIINIIMVFG